MIDHDKRRGPVNSPERGADSDLLDHKGITTAANAIKSLVGPPPDIPLLELNMIEGAAYNAAFRPKLPKV